MNLPSPFRRASAFLQRHRLLLVCGALVLFFGIIWFSPLRMGAVQTFLTITGTTPPHDMHGRTNVLLLGVGDDNHAGADLTDAMMIASIEPSSQSVVLLSIPRDLYLSGEGIGASGRINTLYAFTKSRVKREHKTFTQAEVSHAALRMVASDVSTMFDVPIHGVVKIDFTAAVTAVDLIGGIDIVVPKTIIDYAYPVTEQRTGLFKITAGPHHLNGETALKYARTRHSSTDFDRSIRQQQIMQAMMQKARRLTPPEQIIVALFFLRHASEHAETTFSTRQLLGLAQLATAIPQRNVIRTQIDYSFLFAPDPALYEGANVLLPIPTPGDPTGWKRIRSFVSDVLMKRAIGGM